MARVAILWPASTIFAHYTPQKRNPLSDRTEFDFNVLTVKLTPNHDCPVSWGNMSQALQAYSMVEALELQLDGLRQGATLNSTS